MHIGVFTYYYLPIVNGVTLAIAEWKKRAGETGIRQTIFVPQLDPFKPISHPDIFEYPAVPLYKKFGITAPLFAEMLLPGEMAKRKINLVHIHHPSLIGFTALKIARKLGLPVVFTYHSRYGDYARHYLPFLPSKIIRWLVKGQVIKFINQCDIVTVALPSMVSFLRKEGVKIPVRVVPIGIDTENFDQISKSYARKLLGFRQDEKIILTIGRLAKEKNLRFILRSFFRVVQLNGSGVKLVIVGKPMGEERWINRYIHKKMISHLVKLVGEVNTQLIPKYLAACDVFAFASRTETFGRVYLEAMAAGRPIVALDTPFLQDLLTNGKSALLVNTRLANVFALAVGQVLNNQKFAKNLSSNAQRIAREFYDSRIVFKQLQSAYRAAIKIKKHG